MSNANSRLERGGGFAFGDVLLYDVAMPDTSRNPHYLVAGALAVIAIIAIAAYMYTSRAPNNAGAAPDASSTPITTTVNGVTVSGGTATVTETPAQTMQAPDFRTPLVFKDTVSADVRTALTKQFDATVKILAGDKTNFAAWINLGTLRKMTDDYAGAAADWKYAAYLYPKSTVASDNLGGLYLDYLKDYPKAEAYFKLSIANDPQDINAYQQLVSLYTTYGYKDVATALALVKRGLAANPNNPTLLQIQSELEAK